MLSSVLLDDCGVLIYLQAGTLQSGDSTPCAYIYVFVAPPNATSVHLCACLHHCLHSAPTMPTETQSRLGRCASKRTVLAAAPLKHLLLPT